MVKYVIDLDENPDIDLLVDALNTLKDLHRFWIDVELSTGGFFLPDGSDVGDVEAEEVMPLSLMILQQCLDAYLEDAASGTPQAEGQEPHTKGDGVESP